MCSGNRNEKHHLVSRIFNDTLEIHICTLLWEQYFFISLFTLLPIFYWPLFIYYHLYILYSPIVYMNVFPHRNINVLKYLRNLRKHLTVIGNFSMLFQPLNFWQKRFMTIPKEYFSIKYSKKELQNIVMSKICDVWYDSPNIWYIGFILHRYVHISIIYLWREK